MINIISHQGNVIKTTMRYNFIPTGMAITIKKIITSDGKDVEKLGYSPCSYYRKQFGSS